MSTQYRRQRLQACGVRRCSQPVIANNNDGHRTACARTSAPLCRGIDDDRTGRSRRSRAETARGTSAGAYRIRSTVNQVLNTNSSLGPGDRSSTYLRSFPHAHGLDVVSGPAESVGRRARFAHQGGLYLRWCWLGCRDCVRPALCFKVDAY